MVEQSADPDASLSRAVDFIPQGLAIFDADLKLVTANKRYQELLNLPAAYLESGTLLYELALFAGRRGDLGPGAPEALARSRVEALRLGPSAISQRIGTSGQNLEIYASNLPTGGLIISIADITARVAAEAELERLNASLEGRVRDRTAALTRVNSELEIARAKADTANRDKTRFLAAASHDLLQPLNAARLYTATLVERAGGAGMGELAHAIEASLNAVEEIMSALLDISRIDSGALKPVPSVFNLRELTKKLEVEFGPLARAKSIRLKLIDTRVAASADRALVGRIVQNLVSNAIKYTKPGGRVLVGCRRRGGRLRLDVIDTGIGFNKDQHGLVFAEFSRLEQGVRMASGLGLGLSIVQRLVAAMGLTLELESREGQGSRFSLYLPMARSDGHGGERAGERRDALSNLGGLKVLCVDNERTILDAMNGLLSGWGCEVRLARSLKEIDKNELLVGWLPDLVLMDYHLDQTSGLDAIEWLRHNVGGHLPAALLTADRSAMVRTLAEERGIAVVTKPVKPAALRATISGLAGQRSGEKIRSEQGRVS